MLIPGLWISIPFRQAKVRDVLPPAGWRGAPSIRRSSLCGSGDIVGLRCHN